MRRSAEYRAPQGSDVIAKVIRGTRVRPLLAYLYGPGRANEHADPHLVTGFGDPVELEPEAHPDGSRDLRRLTGLLLQPLAAESGPRAAKPVWHCSVRAAPGDRLLSDSEWGQVAAQVMDRTGLAPQDDDQGVRWLAVRHAPDHVHIVATLARQDGTRPKIWNDFYRVREACQAAEQRLGLQATAPADRTAARRPSRAETERAARLGWTEAPRVTLRREVCAGAAAASTEQEFFARLRETGVLVRQRASTRNPGEITGYAVGLAHHANQDGTVVWYGGGKLAADLTLPKLRQRWAPRTEAAPRPARHRITAAERNAAYEHAAHQARAAARNIRRCCTSDPAQAADAAWAAADTLHAAALTLRSPELRRAADAYDRAARAPYGRIPSCTRTGERLRVLARRLGAIGMASSAHRPAADDLMLSLAMLAVAVADLRAVQQHAAQAAAARRAAEYLWEVAAADGRATARDLTRDPSRVRASDMARRDFPTGLTALRQVVSGGPAVPMAHPLRHAESPRARPRPPRPPPG
jgi:hypothetical protein